MTQPPPTRRQRLNHPQLAALLAILLFAAFVRFDQITGPSLWMDEIWSIEMAMGHGSAHDHLPAGVIREDQPQLTNPADAAPWWSILTHMGGVTHPPLYFLILRAWIDVFGISAASVRTLSAVFSLAAIVLFFDICRFLHGNRLALLAAALFAVSVIQIESAQDGRSYTVLTFFALAAADGVVRIQFLGARLPRLIAVGVFACAMVLTHYFGVGAVFALAIYAWLAMPRSAQFQSFIALAAAGIACLAICVPILISQKNTLPSLSPTFLREHAGVNHPMATAYRLIGLPTEFLFGGEANDLTSRMPTYLVRAIFLLALILPAIRLAWRRDYLFWMLWAWGTLGFVAVLDLVHSTTLLEYPRYTMVACPAVCASIAVFDWPRIRIGRQIVALLFVAAVAAAAINRLLWPIAAKNDWRQLADDLKSTAAPNDLFIFSNPDPWVSSGTWYLGIQYYTPSFAHPWLILSDPPGGDLLRQLRSRDHVWLIGIAPRYLAPRLLPGFYPDMEIRTSAGIACRFVRVGQSPSATGP
jgi:4-amino-4-deoxy-L-arabinose transferase-like glycosyltransferase